MRCDYACRSPEHGIARRSFLGGLAAGLGFAGAGGLGNVVRTAAADELARKQKQVLLIYLAGGASQLETWDPKPGTDTGGPFRAIPTSVPGVHISELLPYSALQMHRLSIVRSVNTEENDHGKGAYFMQTGRRQDPANDYPHLGAVAARCLAPEDTPLPGFIHILPGGSGIGQSDAAFLGPQYASVTLGDGKPPANIVRPESIAEASDQARQALRRQLTNRFNQGRRTAATEAYTSTFDQALRLMEQRQLFDVSQEPPADLDRYGTHDFGRHALLARRLIENDVTFVKLSHREYDTHYENFDFHIEQMGEFDRTFATLIDDLAQRGRLESTLVIVMAEFGRTPQINLYYGRDHWGHAWSVALAGCGIQPGAVVGKTNDNGTAVVDRQVHGGHLFHTYLRAVGLDSTGQFDVDGRPVQMADPAASAIEELLA
jgi:uncharacterized protein (DUF1501 family)